MSPDPATVLDRLRTLRPRVHCLVGGVSAPLVADGLLAAGARPSVTATAGEAPALVRGAQALLVNLAALGEETARAVLPTVASARQAGMPWVLDPAAIGPTPVRTPLAHNLARFHPDVVRGNASEVLTLAGQDGGAHGADTAATVHDARDAARRLATTLGGVVSVSGPADLVTDGKHDRWCARGHGWAPLVTGTGCLLGALTAACRAVAPPFEAAVAAALLMGVAAERAATVSAGPGSFKTALVDALHLLPPAELITEDAQLITGDAR